MMKPKHPYSYEIITKDGKKITNRMKIGIELLATKESMAKKILDFKYPNCEIVHLKPKHILGIPTDPNYRLRL